jgi:asparagine synthase (glutamine-hydrolysing)
MLYDTERRTFFAARDRFGIKPLYYRVSDEGIAFASEIKQFTTLPGWKAVLNPQRAYDFLNWGITDHTDETLFKGVFQLRGGEAVEIDIAAIEKGSATYQAGARIPVMQWYRLEPKPFTGTPEEAAAAFRERLLDSVRLHLRADVPVGSCLSGGLDSSSIVCVVNRLLREQSADHLQKTFSACATIDRYDERKWIDVVVGATGVDASFVYPELGDLFTDAGRITWHQDEPFGSTSLYAQWKVFELAGKGPVKVMLDGQGADEYIGGYHAFFSARLGGLLRAGKLTTLAREARALRRVHGFSYGRIAAHIADGVLPEPVKDLARKMSRRATAAPAWLDMDRLGSVAANPFQSAGASSARSVRDLSIAQLTASNLQMLLHWEDRDSMAHSIESRVPFLDYRLVEFVLGLPDELKVSEGMTKRILRTGMNGMLPPAIRDRTDKLGFVTPEQTWMRESAPDLFREKLREAVAASHGILRADESRKILDEVIDGRRPFSFLPWRMINFGLWMKEFSVALA